MTSPQAILTGAVLIAAAVILSNGGEAVSAGASGKYMVSVGSITAYELDTETGEIRACIVTTPPPFSAVGCSPWSAPWIER